MTVLAGAVTAALISLSFVDGTGGQTRLATQLLAGTSAIVLVILFLYAPVWVAKSVPELGPDYFTLPNPLILSFDGGSTWEVAGFEPRRRFTMSEISRVGFHAAKRNRNPGSSSFGRWMLTRPDINFLMIGYDAGIVEKTICIAESSLGSDGIEKILGWSRERGIRIDVL